MVGASTLAAIMIIRLVLESVDGCLLVTTNISGGDVGGSGASPAAETQ